MALFWRFTKNMAKNGPISAAKTSQRKISRKKSRKMANLTSEITKNGEKWTFKNKIYAKFLGEKMAL